MKIIEEQNMTDEPNPDITGNMDVPADVPSAKKVYSKPMLIVLLHASTHAGKAYNTTEVTYPTPFASAQTFLGPS